MKRRFSPLRLILVPLALIAAGVLRHAEAQPLPIAPGVAYSQERQEAGPWEVRTVSLDRSSKYARLDMALGMGQLRGVEAMSGIIRRETSSDDYVVAGVNADFFTMAGNPRAGAVSGLAVRRGELVATAHGRPAFLMMRDGTPCIGTFDTTGTLETPAGNISIGDVNNEIPKGAACLYAAIYGWPQTRGCVVVRVEGLPLRPNGSWRGKVSQLVPDGSSREARRDEVLIRADGDAATTLAKLKPGDPVQISLHTAGLEAPVEMAAGGSTVLVDRGQIAVADDPKAPRHPRTAVGFNGRRIVLVTVDGRQKGWSVGMTMHELARLMRGLGCTSALNLDGGGSTSAWVRGRVMNRPSDGRERLIANAVLVRSAAPRGAAARLLVRPRHVTAAPGVPVPLTVQATDGGYSPVPTPGALEVLGMRSADSRITARLVGGALVLAGDPGEGVVRVGIRGRPGLVAAVRVTVLPRIAQ
jgi:hypothetical protein